MYNHINDFDFHLPERLIAQHPVEPRSASRLLTVDISTGTIKHQQFADLLAWVRAGDLVILNDTQVIPARLFGSKASGGKLECLIERVLSDHEALAQLRVSKSPKIRSQILLADGAFSATVLARHNDLYHLRFNSETPLLTLLNQYGLIPLPPYIERACETTDIQRYQTVYAHNPGAIAAPTAGLHFDKETLSALQAKSVQLAYVTLHIGAGTFQPVRVDFLDQHAMHAEYMQLSAETCTAIANCRQRGGRVLAVGTTVTRCLETAAKKGALASYQGDTNLFIRPGFQFQVVDALLTNFHLPKSTLLMLVSAFGGYELIRRAYQAAIEQNYRFFSYGDAMLLYCRSE